MRSIGVGASLALLACGGGGSGDRSVEGYSTDMKAEFVRACTAAGTDRGSCGCLYDTLEAEVPYERFQDLDQQLRDGTADIPQDIEDMAVACAADPEAELPDG